MQNSIQKFSQTSIVFNKPDILSRKLKTLTSFNCRVEYFLLKFCPHFLFTSVYKRVFGILFILFRSCSFCLDLSDLSNQDDDNTYNMQDLLLIYWVIQKQEIYKLKSMVRNEDFQTIKKSCPLISSISKLSTQNNTPKYLTTNYCNDWRCF